jgi:hypothetical protein
MSVWGKIKRVGAAVATGGLSEAGGIRTVTDAAGHPLVNPDKALPTELTPEGAALARKLPVIGGLIPPEQVDPNSIDTGMGYYGDAGNALRSADANFVRPDNNAQTLYNEAMGRSNVGYQAGQLGAVDLTGADALRGDQTQDLSRLDDAAAGRGPSAAQAQYASALSQAKDQAMALANTSRGAGRGAARLQALSNFGGQAGAQAQNAAALRAQEMQGAQSAYSSALAGARTQDAALATNRAQLGLQHDTAQETANRGAFDSTQTAQRGYLDAAAGAVGQQTNVAQGRAGVAGQQMTLADMQAKTKQRQYELAMQKQKTQADRDAASRQEIAGDVTKLATRA